MLALTGLRVLRDEAFAEGMWEEWEAMIKEISVGLEESGDGTRRAVGRRRVH